MREPPIDAPRSDREWKAFVRQKSFGELIAWGGAGAPTVVPLHYTFDGSGIVEFHLHRANPVWLPLRANPAALLCVTDASVYIPTMWNASPGREPGWAAPTSYYATVQLSGGVELVERPNGLAALLTRQMEAFQPEGGYNPIRPGDTPFGRMLGGIVGARLTIRDVKARFKFGIQKNPEQRRAIAELLAARGGAEDLKARSFILDGLDPTRSALPQDPLGFSSQAAP